MKRDHIAFALVLIIVGSALVARQFLPQWEFLFGWPYWVIGLGLLCVLISAVNRKSALMLLGTLMAGLGVNILLQPQLTGIIWVSMLAFLGLGLILADAVDRGAGGNWRSGLTLIFIAALIFLVSGGSKLLPWPQLTNYWPVIMIVAGVMLLLSSIGKKPKP